MLSRSSNTGRRDMAKKSASAHDPATRFHVVRVCLNYHFNLFASAPVVASY